MKFWIAKIFGKRVDVDEKPKTRGVNGAILTEAGVQLTGYKFLGKMYVTSYSHYFDR